MTIEHKYVILNVDVGDAQLSIGKKLKGFLEERLEQIKNNKQSFLEEIENAFKSNIFDVFSHEDETVNNKISELLLTEQQNLYGFSLEDLFKRKVDELQRKISFINSSDDLDIEIVSTQNVEKFVSKVVWEISVWQTENPENKFSQQHTTYFSSSEVKSDGFSFTEFSSLNSETVLEWVSRKNPMMLERIKEELSCKVENAATEQLTIQNPW